MNATATTQPRRRGWGVMNALRELARPGRSRSTAGEERRRESDRDLSAPQRDRLGASLPFDGSDCD